MSKAVLISIQPKWCEKIANGEKTIEVRKSVPKLERPFKVYIYATWNGSKKEILVKQDGLLFCEDWRKASGLQRASGKVIGEFVCDSMYGISNFLPYDDEPHHSVLPCVLEQTCLEDYEIDEYLGNKDGYGWHISDLKIYDKPKELREFFKPLKYDSDGLILCGTKEEISDIYEWDCETLFGKKYPDFNFENCDCRNCPKTKDFYRLTRPPQSWCYVEELQNG